MNQAHISVVLPIKNSAGIIGALSDTLAARHEAQPFKLFLSDNGSSNNLSGEGRHSTELRG